MLHKIDADQKEIVFMWVPGYVGIQGNESADRAVKEALDKKNAIFRPKTCNCQIYVPNLTERMG